MGEGKPEEQEHSDGDREGARRKEAKPQVDHQRVGEGCGDTESGHSRLVRVGMTPVEE